MLKRSIMQAKKIIYAKRFDGFPKLSDFRFEEETLPDLRDGDILVEALYLSVDPYNRKYMERYDVGVTMIGGQISKVLESKNPNYPKDSIIYGSLGWRTRSVFNPDNAKDHLIQPYILPPLGDLHASLGLGVLGMPGNTAYFGLLKICQPKEGEVVVVSGAAGGVGHVVGQIAKIKGCKVIGICGTDDKCKWLTEVLGFDHAINYKTANIGSELKQYAPDGIDCYFDNIGGEMSSIVNHQMRLFGRIAVCGSTTAAYSLPLEQWPKAATLQPAFVPKQLKMEGFLVFRFWDEWFKAIEELTNWTNEGKIKYHETVTHGFENMPQALIDILNGKNTGKAIVKV